MPFLSLSQFMDSFNTTITTSSAINTSTNSSNCSRERSDSHDSLNEEANHKNTDYLFAPSNFYATTDCKMENFESNNFVQPHTTNGDQEFQFFQSVIHNLIVLNWFI